MTLEVRDPTPEEMQERCRAYDITTGSDEYVLIGWFQMTFNLMTTEEQSEHMVHHLGILAFVGATVEDPLLLEKINYALDTITPRTQALVGRPHAPLSISEEGLEIVAKGIKAFTPALSDLRNPFVIYPITQTSREYYNRMRGIAKEAATRNYEGRRVNSGHSDGQQRDHQEPLGAVPRSRSERSCGAVSCAVTTTTNPEGSITVESTGSAVRRSDNRTSQGQNCGKVRLWRREDAVDSL